MADNQIKTNTKRENGTPRKKKIIPIESNMLIDTHFTICTNSSPINTFLLNLYILKFKRVKIHIGKVNTAKQKYHENSGTPFSTEKMFVKVVLNLK